MIIQKKRSRLVTLQIIRAMTDSEELEAKTKQGIIRKREKGLIVMTAIEMKDDEGGEM